MRNRCWRKSPIFGRSILFFLAVVSFAQRPADSGDDIVQPVSKVDIQIVERAAKVLDSPAKWNRNDNRECPDRAKKVSIYCALEQATKEITGSFEHRGAAMQETRFVIDELQPNSDYEHRLMGYNNDPKTTFQDVQKLFRLTQERITHRIRDQSPKKDPGK